MPLPLILGGIAAAVGIGGHLSAKETNEKAERVSRNAQTIYNEASDKLAQRKALSEVKLIELGKTKQSVLNNSFQTFLNSYEKIKNVEINDSDGIYELSNFKLEDGDVVQITQLCDIYQESLSSGVAGAATGTLLALASTGALTTVAATAASAGAAVITGSVSVATATSVVGSTALGAIASTPLAAIAAPVVLFTGFSASMKADENLEKANKQYRESEIAVEKMKTSMLFCDSITKKAEMFNDLIGELDPYFHKTSLLLEKVTADRPKRLFKKHIPFDIHNLTKEEKDLIFVTRSLAGALKAIIDTPILSGENTLSPKCDEIYNKTKEQAENFKQSANEVLVANYNVKTNVKSLNKIPDTNVSREHSSTLSGDSVLKFIGLIGLIILSFTTQAFLGSLIDSTIIIPAGIMLYSVYTAVLMSDIYAQSRLARGIACLNRVFIYSFCSILVYMYKDINTFDLFDLKVFLPLIIFSVIIINKNSYLSSMGEQLGIFAYNISMYTFVIPFIVGAIILCNMFLPLLSNILLILVAITLIGISISGIKNSDTSTS